MSNNPITFIISLQVQSSLEDKNQRLLENVNQLREELRSVDNRKSSLEQEMRHLQTEVHDNRSKLSRAEASVEVADRVSHTLYTYLCSYQKSEILVLYL